MHDLGRLIASLADAALKGDQRQGIWGDNGIYLSAAGELVRIPFGYIL